MPQEEQTRDRKADHSQTFEVPVESVRKQLNKVLASKGFVQSERLSRFLRFAVEQTLDGRAHQLKEYVLAVEIFDRDESYDPHIDSIVRVEASRLRSKLKDYYEGEGRQDSVRIRLPKGTYIPAFAGPDVTDTGAPKPSVVRFPIETIPPRQQPRSLAGRRVGLPTLIIAAVVVTVITAGVTWWVAHSPESPIQTRFTRLTSDFGLTSEPAVSPDGTLLAYASDRGSDGNLDIWVQQIRRGSPIRLTHHPADDRQPTFSPDGRKIAFRSERDGGGIYVVPTFGGEKTLLANGGHRPRFSPGGDRLAYWGDERHSRTARIFVTFSSRRPAVEFQPGFLSVGHPVWTPDGQHLLFQGSRDAHRDSWDWWVVPVAGGEAIRTGAADVFRQQGLTPPPPHRRILPNMWTSDGEHVIFSATVGDSTNTWRLRVSPTNWRAVGPAWQLTYGTERQGQSFATRDSRLVFSSLRYKSGIWILPIDSHRLEDEPLDKRATRAIRVTQDAADNIRPNLSLDGKKLAFVSNKTGENDVWVRDLDSGKEMALTSTLERETFPILSSNGRKVAFGIGGWEEGDRRPIYMVLSSGGAVEEICDDCGSPRAWATDGAKLLYQYRAGARSRLGLLDLITGQKKDLVQHPKDSFYSPRFSPDDRWITFVARTPPEHDRLIITPFRDGSVPDESCWVTLIEEDSWVDKPRWSGDGDLVYFISDRDGATCIWAQRLEPTTKRPQGSPSAVAHFHHRRRSLAAVTSLGFSVGRDKLVLNLGELSGNIWMAESASGN